MSLQAALEAALPELRAHALARMTSTATVRRRTSRTVQDEESGLEVPVWADVAVDTPLRLRAARNRTVTLGGVEFEQGGAEASLPHDLYDLEDGDLIDVTGGEWPGSVWRIVEAVKGDQQTARRVPVVEVPRPEEWV